LGSLIALGDNAVDTEGEEVNMTLDGVTDGTDVEGAVVDGTVVVGERVGDVVGDTVTGVKYKRIAPLPPGD